MVSLGEFWLGRVVSVNAGDSDEVLSDQKAVFKDEGGGGEAGKGRL